jgi:hypothetical protein
MRNEFPTSNPVIPFPIFYGGPISYYAELIQNEAIWDVHEHFAKQTFRTRMNVLGPQGMLSLNIPVQKGSQDLPMGEVKIANHEPWQRTHWRTLVSSYNSSPFFEFYESLFAPVYATKYDKLVHFLWEIHQQIMLCLQISKSIKCTSEWIPTFENDIRLHYQSKERMAISNRFPAYQQVFSYDRPFEPDLSILDAIFNLGPEAETYLLHIQKMLHS